MKYPSIMLVTASAAALTACGMQGSENIAANVQAANANAENRAEPVPANGAAPEAAPSSAMPVPGSNVEEMIVHPAPPPPPPTPADPHAGHDMGNMANMQH